jgi:predicted component of type VI protein secretion system
VRFSLLIGETEVPLSRGEVLIGRSRSCQVLLDDMLVSRHHARLLVSRGALFIEDLGSSNGVIVNEVPVSGPTPLGEGDRIIVGVQEMWVRALPEDSEPAESGEGPRGARQTLPAPPAVAVVPTSSAPGLAVSKSMSSATGLPVVTHARSAPSDAVRRVASSAPAPVQKVPHAGLEAQESTLRTEKQEGLLTMARMADRMITMGRHDAAVRLLGDHLRSVLAAAHAGRTIPPTVADTVGTHGMKLSDVSHEGEWANIAIELHLLCRRVLPARAAAALESCLTRVPSIDRPLLAQYQATLRELLADLEPKQRTVAERLLALPAR